MILKRKWNAIVLVFLLGLLAGTLIGPRVQVFYWSTVLDRHPNPATKLKAAFHLAGSDQGKYALFKRFDSPKKWVRYSAVYELAYEQSPGIFMKLIYEVPQAGVDEKLAILGGLRDYALQHDHLLGALHSELAEKNDPRVKAEIENVLQDIAEASSRKYVMRSR